MSLICGIFSPAQPQPTLQADLESMLAAASHHARDGSASFFDSEAGIALALSYTATFQPRNQPTTLPWHEDTGLVAAISGNTWPARSQISSSTAAKHDLPLLLEAFSQAPTAFAEELDGDFALFLWDRQRGELHLVADGLAKKPLYYYYEPAEKLLVFSSVLKSVLAHPRVTRELDRPGLSLYLGLSIVPAPFTMIKDVRKILPAEELVFSDNGQRSRRYWQPSPSQFDGDQAATTAATEIAMQNGTERLIAGAESVSVFLSGGVDSSLALAAAKSLDRAEIHALTIAYKDDRASYDVAWAERVARSLNCEQRTITIDPDTDVSPALLSTLLRQIDEPFESGGRVVSEHFLLQAARELGDNSCLTGGGAGLVFNRGRWLRYFRESDGPGSKEDAVHDFIGRLTFFDADQQDRLLTWDVDRAIFPEATLTNLPLMENLDQVQSATLSRVLRGPQSRWGLFGVFIPPLYGAEERAPFFDREVVDLALSMPVAEGAPVRKSESFLAACFKDQIQVDFNQREKRAFPSTPLPTWLAESLIQRLEGLVEEGIVNQGYLERLGKKYREGRKRARLDAWQLFVFYCWYEFHIKQRHPFDAFAGI